MSIRKSTIEMMIASSVLAGFCGAFIWSLNPSQFTLAAPAFFVLLVCVGVFCTLTVRDGHPPFVDLGLVAVAVSSIYVALPALMLAGANGELTPISDSRLYSYSPTPEDLSRLIWWGFWYIAALSFGYLVFRTRPCATYADRIKRWSDVDTYCVLVVFLILSAVLLVIQLVFNVDFNSSYAKSTDPFAGLPVFVQQVSQKLIGINGVLTIGLILISVINFNRLFYRAVLAVWGGWIIIDTALTLGSRTKAAVFLLTLFFAYKRLIGGRSVAGVIFFVFIFLFSLLYFEIKRAGIQISDLAPVLSKATEFQSLLSTSYDILARKESGTLSEVPVGLYFADIVRLIPQQILPFAKVDQADWYLGEIGIRGSGHGYMFGVLAEAAVGFGVLELLFRGFFLGAILAGIHNWYFRRRTSFWPLVFYIWCCVTVYYTYRAGTLYSLSFILTYFVPAYLLYRLCKFVFTRSVGGHLL